MRLLAYAAARNSAMLAHSRLRVINSNPVAADANKLPAFAPVTFAATLFAALFSVALAAHVRRAAVGIVGIRRRGRR